MDHPHDQEPGAPVRSGIPEHGRIPKHYAVKAQVAALLDESGALGRRTPGAARRGGRVTSGIRFDRVSVAHDGTSSPRRT